MDPEMAKKIRDHEIYNYLGPTEKSPDGKLSSSDEEQIAFSVFPKDGKIVISFNSPVRWMGMTTNQAIDLGNCLLKHARKLTKKVHAN